MSKKGIILVSSTFIILLILLNIYVYINSLRISSYIDETNSHSNNIVLISKFRTDINEMAQAQKLYLLTSKEEYKVKYDQHLNSIYKIIDDMEVSGGISNEERNEIKSTIDDYDKLNIKSIQKVEKKNISEEMESKINDANESQMKILKQLEKSVDGTNQALTDSNNNIVEVAKKQKGSVQTVSTVMTGIGSSLLYIIKKNSSKMGKEASKIIDCITETESNHEKENKEEINNDKNTKSNSGNIDSKEANSLQDYRYIKEYMENLILYEKALNSIKLTYKQSSKIEEKLNKINTLISQIFTSLNQLRLNIEECESCPNKIKIDLIKDINDKMIQLKILFESLPNHNEIIKECSEEVIYNEINN